ncbi:putative NAD(P)H nitroreductase YdjA [compost metagenome]
MVYDELAQVIKERRTIRRFKGQSIPEQLIYELLNDAVWAPYHSAKEPWRFILFSEEGRQAFASAVLTTYTPEEIEKYGESATRDYCENAAAHLIVIVKAESRPKEAEEALMACATFIQNLQLLAWNRGIGMVWKTNEYNDDPRFYEAIGLKSGERVAGTLHMGYYDADNIPKSRPRLRAEQLTVWHKDCSIEV